MEKAPVYTNYTTHLEKFNVSAHTHTLKFIMYLHTPTHKRLTTHLEILNAPTHKLNHSSRNFNVATYTQTYHSSINFKCTYTQIYLLSRNLYLHRNLTTHLEILNAPTHKLTTRLEILNVPTHKLTTHLEVHVPAYKLNH